MTLPQNKDINFLSQIGSKYRGFKDVQFIVFGLFRHWCVCVWGGGVQNQTHGANKENTCTRRNKVITKSKEQFMNTFLL